MADPICTVDVVLLTLQRQELHVALLKREHEPFAGLLALPGGYVHAETDRDTEDTAVRVLRDKTGFTSPYLEQLATFSGSARDPRGWSLSVVYYALLPVELVQAGGQQGLVWCAVSKVKSLPFDHQAMIAAALQRVRNKSSYSSLPVYLCGEQFTLPQLQAVYECLLDGPINKVSFRRKMDELEMLEPVLGEMDGGKAHRPAQLYRLKPAFRQRLSLTERGLGSGS